MDLPSLLLTLLLGLFTWAAYRLAVALGKKS